MKLVLVALFTLVALSLYSGAEAQTTILVDTSMNVPTVKVSDDSFAPMCEGFKLSLDKGNDSGILVFRPKVMPFSQDAKSGSVWILDGISGKKVEVAQSRLPLVLQKLSGSVVRNVLQISCYTTNMMFFGKRDVIILTASVADANTVADALR